MKWKGVMACGISSLAMFEFDFSLLPAPVYRGWLSAGWHERNWEKLPPLNFPLPPPHQTAYTFAFLLFSDLTICLVSIRQKYFHVLLKKPAKHMIFSHFYRIQVSLGSDLWVRLSLTEWERVLQMWMWLWLMKIPTDTANKAIQGNVAMRVAPSGGQIWNLCKRHHLVAKLLLMQVAAHGGQNWNHRVFIFYFRLNLYWF